MKDIRFVRLADFCLIKDRESKFRLYINSDKCFTSFNKFIINELDDKSSQIDLLSEKVDRVHAVDLCDFLFEIFNSY